MTIEKKGKKIFSLSLLYSLFEAGMTKSQRPDLEQAAADTFSPCHVAKLKKNDFQS